MTISSLKVKTKGMPGSRLEVELEIPSSQCKTTYEEALAALSRSANLPGFRKGKVPKAVLLQQIGQKRIQASALETLLSKAWDQALKQESIKPLCEPELIGGFEKLLEKFNPEKNLTLTLATDITPIAKLNNTKGLSAEVEKISFDPKKVDELIEQSRKQLATVIPVENRNAAKGDIAVISFKGIFTDDKSEIEGGSSESMDVELEKEQMIPGFIEGIIGMNIDEEKTVQCTFPKDYSQEKARGRQAEFTIQLKDLKTRELPKLDDDFAKQTSDQTNMVDLRNELTKRLKEDTSLRNQKNKHEALLQELVKELEIDLPKSLIENETRNLIEQTARNFAQQGIDVKSTFTPELIKKLMESSKPEAEENLRKQFAVSALAQQEGLEVTDKELNQKLNEIKAELAGEKNIDQNKLKEVVSADLLQEKVFLWLEENNDVIDQASKKSPKQKNTTEKQSSKTKSTKTTQKKPKSEG